MSNVRPQEMRESSDVYAYFWVQGYDCPHEEVSASLGLKPTGVQSVGGAHRQHNPQVNRWELLSPLARGEGLLQEYLEALLGLLEPGASQVREAAAKWSAGISCVGYYYGSNPGLHLSAALLGRLAALQLPVDFDLYNYAESDAAA